MPLRRSWKELAPGLLAGALVAASAAAILLFARVGALHGDTFTLHLAVQDARGLIRGSPVWLNGDKIGLVERIGFRPPSVDTMHRVLIEVRVLERHRQFVKRDAPVQIQSGGSLIGAPVVAFGEGGVRSAPVADGDTIVARAPMNLDALTSDASVAARQLPAIMNNVKLLGAQMQSTRGTLGALGLAQDEDGAPLQAARANASRIGSRLTDGRGTLGLAMGGRGALVMRAKRGMARADSVRALLASNATSLGRFRRDSTLLREVDDIRNELAIVQALLKEPRGTAGRMVHDSAFVQALAGAQQEMGVLFADIKAHPLRYVRF